MSEPTGCLYSRRELTVRGRRVSLLCPSVPPDAVVYLHESGQALEETAALLASLLPDGITPALVVPDVDWNADLSPWPAPRVFRGGEAFAGNGAAYLAELTSSVLPAAEAALRVSPAPARRIIAGYSLAGLFALFAALSTDAFGACVSASGSLWFDGFASRLSDVSPTHLPAFAYFSLGDREKLTRNPRMALVEDATRQVEACLAASGVRTVYVSESGGHFEDPAGRLVRGIRKALEEIRL